MPGTHVLLDYENVQPSDDELRAMVPDAGQVWVFHGPHQRQVEQRFASFGADVTAVPIKQDWEERAGLSPVVLHGLHRLAEPGLDDGRHGQRQGLRADAEHAKAMGFVVRQQSHRQVKPAAKKTAAKKVVAKTAPVKKAAAKKQAAKQVPAKNAAVKKVSPAPAAKKAPAAKVAPAKKAAPVKKAVAKPAAQDFVYNMPTGFIPGYKDSLLTRPNTKSCN